MQKHIDGYIKGVLSGDLICISGKLNKNDQNDVPEEKNLFLTFVQSPKINSQTTYEEEPFAWEARNFLRNMLIGKVIKYQIDYKNGDQNFGQVFLDGKNINIEVIKSGYGVVKQNKLNESFVKTDFYTKIKSAEAVAQAGKLGIWKESTNILRRKISKQEEVDLKDLYDKVKGKTIKGMIEFVFNCSSLLVLFNDHDCILRCTLRFCAIPKKETEFYLSGKAYVERLFNHRDVQVKVHYLDEKGFVIDIIDERKNKDGELEIKNLALSVLSGGYTKLFVPSTFSSEKQDIEAAKSSQTLAQENGLRSWEGFVPKKEAPKQESNTSPSSVSQGNFDGLVYLIHTGDSLTLKSKDGSLHRVFLSHLKAPQFGKIGTGEEDKPWAWQAKEYLRKTYIGKKVKAVFDYSKDVNTKVMNFYSLITIDNETNINLDLLLNGYAAYMPSKNESNTSKFIGDYSQAEVKSKENKVGIHSNKDPGNPNYCDLIAANPKKKKEFTNKNSSLGRGVKCVVEYAFSAFRYKIRVPSTSCYVPFKLIGIKGAEKDANNTKQLNDLFEKSLDYVNERFIQREAVIDVIQSDKNGNYFGYLHVNNINVGNELIKEGLAIIHNPQNVNLPDVFNKSEAKAQESKLNIWSFQGLHKIIKDSDVINVSKDETIKNLTEKDEIIKIRITDMVSFKQFYGNILPNKSLSLIEKTLLAYDESQKTPKQLDPQIKKGTLCLLKYSVDERHYRVLVTGILKDDKYEVDFIDYGTIDIVNKKDLYKIDESLSVIEGQVVEFELASIKFSKNSKKKSFELYPNLIDLEGSYTARVCYTYQVYGKIKYGVIIYDGQSTSTVDSMHSKLVSKGFAKIDSKKPLPKSVSELKELEKKARDNAIGMWTEMEESDKEDEEI